MRSAGRMLVEVISAINTLAFHRDAAWLFWHLDAANTLCANGGDGLHLHHHLAKPQHEVWLGALHGHSQDIDKF